jgi:Mor family transcriptional regulator
MNGLAMLDSPTRLRRPDRITIHAARVRTSTLDSIAEAIGTSAAAKVVAEFGGRRLYVPRRAHPEDALARLIGARAAAELARVFGGDRIMIPADFERAHRRERIVEARRRGLTISSIAREIRCTERYVYKVLAQARQG